MAQNEDLAKNVDEIIAGFLSYLKNEKKVNLLPHIVKKLHQHISLTQVEGEIISTVPLKPEQISTISALIEEKFHKRVQFTNRIDRSIVGGIVISFDDIIIDQSIKAQLDELKKKSYGY